MPSSEPDGGGVVIVLAAGRGSRMGGPKALMTVLGRAWWRVQQERLAHARRESIWVVSPEVRAAIACDAVAPAQLVDADPAAPMFASILAGVEAARSGAQPRWIHVLPVDVPAPQATTFDALEFAAKTAGVAVPSYLGKTGHPVCLSWRWIETTLLPAVRPAGGRATIESLRLDVMATASRVVVDVADADVVVNLNTSDDVARWLERITPRR